MRHRRARRGAVGTGPWRLGRWLTTAGVLARGWWLRQRSTQQVQAGRAPGTAAAVPAGRSIWRQWTDGLFAGRCPRCPGRWQPLVGHPHAFREPEQIGKWRGAGHPGGCGQAGTARRAGYCWVDRTSQQPAALPCKAVGSKECQTCRYFANFVTLGLVMRAEFGSIVGSVSPRLLADNFHLHINHLRNIPEESPP